MFVRTRRRFTSVSLLGSALIGTFFLERTTFAQTTVNGVPDANGEGFDTHLFRPAPDSKGFFHTNGSSILGANDVSFGLVIDYGHALLRVNEQGQRLPRLIEHSIQGSLFFNYGIANVGAIGLSLPVNLMVGQQQVGAQGQPLFPNQWSNDELRSQTIGSPALHGKLRILRVERGFGLAASVQAGVSLSDAPKNAGADPGGFVWPQLIAERRFGATGWLKIGANAGFRFHPPSATVLPLERGTFRDGQRATYGLGVAIRVAEPLDIIADTYGTYLMSDADSGVKLSNEVVGGLKIFVERNSFLILGAGGRYTGGFEAANLRGFIGVVFEPSIGDRDGDGIKDDDDKCPDQPEDFDGIEDDDGCPEVEQERFEVPRKVDRCPDQPKALDSDHDADGCPKPKVPVDGDRDGDGIPDSRDHCPDVPETFNGFEDEDGCPDKGDVTVGEGGLVILKKIKFAKDSAEILAESNDIIDQIAGAIKVHPEFLLMEVAGHADERAPDQYNLQLTQKRVDSVVSALTIRGVARGRLRSKGYGEYCPEDEGHDEAAYEKNRRVEFKIVKNSDGTKAPPLGCENATKHGVKPDAIP
jgi:OmpA-OmpF porin, OOP family